jgi:RNA polymerase sigma-70 factor (ECF subfamily)
MAVEANIFSDEELIDQAKRGMTPAFGRLVERYQDQIYNLACRTLGDPNRARDVAQEAFIRAWRALSGFQGNSKFSSWLYRITINCCYSELRRRGLPADSMPSQEMDEFKIASGSPGLEHSMEERDLVDKLLVKLPPLYRGIVVLHYLQGLNCQEISDITGRPVGTIKAYLHRSREKLRSIAGKLLSDLDHQSNIRDMAS